MYPSKSKAAEIARDTVEIVSAGRYTNARGEKVSVRHAVEAAADNTVSYPPDAPLPRFQPPDRATVYEVVNDTTLAAARQLVLAGFNPVALNFASARNPGGGFLNGARAQEESLCRSSALYWCINGNAMYRHHAAVPGGMYTNYAIYSPAVPVFKDDAGDKLDAPYECAFVTAPAVNAGAIRDSERERVRAEMDDRIEKVLHIMAGHGHDAAVLGAWGCGVFKNDPRADRGVVREGAAGPVRGRVREGGVRGALVRRRNDPPLRRALRVSGHAPRSGLLVVTRFSGFPKYRAGKRTS